MNKTSDRRNEEGKETRELIDVIINSFPKENRYYWVNALVKRGEISETIAGRILNK